MKTITHSAGKWLLATKNYALLIVLILTICTSVFAEDPNWWHYQNNWHSTYEDPNGGIPATTFTTDWHDGNCWNSQNNGFGFGARPPDDTVYAAIEAKPPGLEIVGDVECSRLSIHPWSWEYAPNIEVNIMPTAGTISCGVCIGIGDRVDYDSATQGHGTLNVYGGTMTTPTAPEGPEGDISGLWVGGGQVKTGNCYGIVNMYGGAIIVPRVAVYYGIVNLYGGLLYQTDTNAGDFVISESRTMNKINVCDDGNDQTPPGELRLKGDRIEQVNYYIQQGRICPCGEQNALNVAYNSGLNYTSVKSALPFYVDCNATGDNNGTSWANAYKYLQNALWAAGPGAVIWVAQGTYRPDQDTNNPSGTGDYLATFELENGVALYGGFPSGGGDWSSRNPNTYETILSGEIGAPNSYHVVSSWFIDSSAILDGFTITAGEAIGIPWNASGGGMYNFQASPTVSNCTFSGNVAYDGGGIYNDINSSPAISNCTFNSNQGGRGGGIFNYYNTSTVVTNCTFNSNISLWLGGGIFNENDSSPTLTNCTFSGNSADWEGGGIYDNNSSPTMTDCNFSGNSASFGSAMYIQSGSSSNVRMNGCTFSSGSDIRGNGDINIVYGGEVVVEANAIVNFTDPCYPNVYGTIYCNGLLKIKDNGQLKHATVNVSRQAGGYFGKFVVEDSATVTNLDIYSDGDRFMDVNSDTFTGTIANNRIYVTITEGQNGSTEGILEARGLELPSHPCDFNEPNVLACWIDGNAMPEFDTTSWTLERLEVAAGAKVTLVDRFSSGNGDPEVLYVKDINLGAGCVLNVGSKHLYYTNLSGDPNLIKKEAMLGSSLGEINSDSNEEFERRVSNNNYIDPADPNSSRVYIERVVGLEPDPNGMILMRNLEDMNGQRIFARAKGEFAPAVEDEIIRIRFNYLFNTTDPNAQIVVYLSDVPEMQEPRDPNHYIEVGRVLNPPWPRPGSADSNLFGNFDELVSTGGLDLSMGTWIELELVEPASGGGGFFALGYGKGMQLMGSGGDGASGYTDDWTAGISCQSLCMGIYCRDLVNPPCVVTVADFLKVVTGTGTSGSPACVDGTFSADGYTDSYDTVSWDWMLKTDNTDEECGEGPLSGGAEGFAASRFGAFGGDAGLLDLSGLNDLLISGKQSSTDDETKMKDRLYVFDSNSNYIEPIGLEPDNRCNIRVVRGEGNDLYLINSQSGVSDLNTGEPIVPPVLGPLTYDDDPRYHHTATVYVGIQGTGTDDGPYGRPIIDAAFDANANCVYVVPVVVVPVGDEPNAYTAAAKLQLNPYHVVKLYDGPILLPNDNQRKYRNTLREIELDAVGNVYVTNAHQLNGSDILWKFEPNGVMVRRRDLDLNSPFVRAPTGMCVSSAKNVLYLASSFRNEAAPDSAVIYGFSTEDFSLARTITVRGMHHVTSITEDPVTNSLWVTGFNLNSNPAPMLYDPYIAKVPFDINDVNALYISDADDLAMPLSICWTGALLPPEKYGGADLNGDDIVNIKDFAKLAAYWRHTDCSPLNNYCEGADLEPQVLPDGDVDLFDLDTLADNWLNTNCQ